jgi:hypothetical protein
VTRKQIKRRPARTVAERLREEAATRPDQTEVRIALRPGVTARRDGIWERICRDGRVVLDISPAVAAQLFDYVPNL